MGNVFITLENGYISAWSYEPFTDAQEINSEVGLIGLLGCVKLVDGKAVLDKEKQSQLLEQQIADDKPEIKELIARQNLTEATVLELADILLS